LLLKPDRSRVPELVSIRHGRMLVSPFAFFRGAALPMAADLASDNHREVLSPDNPKGAKLPSDSRELDQRSSAEYQVN
jgi:hypothetical protein